MTATYRNSWHTPSGLDPEFYTTDARPIEHAGCVIYQRIKGVCWDTVKDGVCLAQRGGLEGAKLAAERIAAGKHPRGLEWDAPSTRKEETQIGLFDQPELDA